MKLVIYRVRSSVAGVRVVDFEKAILPRKRHGAEIDHYVNRERARPLGQHHHNLESERASLIRGRTD
jgi:hypothetical protein